MSIWLANIGSQPLKHVWVTLEAINRVSDPVEDRARRTTRVVCNYVGPLEAGQVDHPRYPNAFWSHEHDHSEVRRIRAVFMDGSESETERPPSALVSTPGTSSDLMRETNDLRVLPPAEDEAFSGPPS